MIPVQFIYFAVLLNLTGHLLYSRSIIKGNAKPNLASWIPWMLAPLAGTFFEIKAGAGLSVLPVFMAGFGPVIIITVALLTKNGIWKVSRFDIFCGLISLFALVVYIFTHNASISIVFAILSDLLAFIPTGIKGWKFPESEYHSTYSLPIISNTIGLLIIKNWSFPIYGFGVYLVIANIAMVCILFRNKITSIFSRISAQS